jgi:two-component system, NarL family, nitrate/nitrite response regulator NarL
MSAEMRRQAPADPAKAPLRILVLSNQLLIRAGLRKLIEGADRACEVHEADAGPDALEATTAFRPDVVVVDADACDPVQLASIARAVHRAGSARLLALACECTPEVRRSLLGIGAMGCVRKDEPADALMKAIDKVALGGVWFDRATLSEVVAGLRGVDGGDGVAPCEAAALTSRESEIVESVARGLKNKQVARRLFISEVTVRHHLTSIYSTLGISNRQQLMLYAFRQGLVPPPSRAG